MDVNVRGDITPIDDFDIGLRKAKIDTEEHAPSC